MKDDNVFKAAGALTGGIGGQLDACGSLLGASLMFGAVMGRGISEPTDNEKLGESITMAAQIYKWFEKEFGSATCKDIRTKFGGGVLYDTHIPWQAELAKAAHIHEQCTEMVGKAASRAAEMFWDAQHKTK